MWWRSMLFLALVFSLPLPSCTAGEGKLFPAAVQPAGTAIRVSGSGTALPLVKKLADAFRRQHPEAAFEFLAGTNSGGAVQGLVMDTLDLAVVNRPLLATEADEGLAYREFARDAIAFAVNLPSPIYGLSRDQMQEVYGGSLVDWKQLGGESTPILVLDRDEDESARKLVLLPLLDGRSVKARAIVLATADDMVMALEGTPNALGYTSLGLLRIRKTPRVRVLALDGEIPGAHTLAQGSYPWYLTFGLVNRLDASPSLRSFVDFALGPMGRQVLEEYGYAGP